MEQVGTYAALLVELDRKPVLHGDDAGFLAGLRDLTHKIEAMRNCVAHYRRPSKELTNHYQNELPQLHEALDLFLERNRGEWEDSLDEGEWTWDRFAREAVERAMETAEWDQESKTIEVHERDEPRSGETVANREHLVRYLEQVAEAAFYGNCSKDDDGDWISECDANGVVEGVLADYEDRLTEFFAPAEEDEDEDQDEDGEVAPPVPPQST
jgi:hypothetical protein